MEYALALLQGITKNAPFLVGFIMPLIVEWVLSNSSVTSEKGKTLIALGSCFLAAVIIHWNEIAYGTPEQALVITGIFFAECQTLYNLYWKNSLLRYKIKGETPPSVTEEEVPHRLPQYESPQVLQ